MSPLVNRKVSSAEDKREAEFKNIKLDREHYGRLLVLSALWRGGSPAEMVADYVDSVWTQRGEFIPEDLTPEDFDGVHEA